MKRFFSRFKGSSRIEAKNRLKSVINNDRMNVSQNTTTEKIKKDVTAVLLKYAGKNVNSLQVSVACNSPSHCTLAATIPLDTALKKGPMV